MKYLLIFILITIFGCVNRSSIDKLKEVNVSQSQIRIQNLVDSFKVDYREDTTDLQKDKTVKSYNEKFFYLLRHRIDSIKVHVDSVVVDSNTIMTDFHCSKDIEFKFALTFDYPKTKFFDSLFECMKGFKPNSDTITNFEFLGCVYLNNPLDNSSSTLNVCAVPFFR